MEFSVHSLQNLEEKFRTLSDTVSKQMNCRNPEDMTLDMLKSRNVTKDILMGLVLQMGAVICDSKAVLRSAIVKFDVQRSDLLDNQKSLIETQNELIKCKTSKLDSVQQTVQSEIKSFSEAVKKNCVSATMSSASIKKAVKSVITENDRSKNFLIFGAQEELECDETEFDEKALIEDIFGLIKPKERPVIEKWERVGIKKPDDTGPGRPIKVTLRNPESVQQVLRNAKILKTLAAATSTGYNFSYNRIYLSPDRSREERRTRQKLVKELKKRIEKDSSKRYFIKDDQVCVAEEPAP